MDDETRKILTNHEKRISALEAPQPKSKASQSVKQKKSLADYVIELRDKKFFSQPKTAEETQKKLQGIYNCEADRVAMGLLRLASRKQLRKASKTINGKKYKAYVW